MTKDRLSEADRARHEWREARAALARASERLHEVNIALVDAEREFSAARIRLEYVQAALHPEDKHDRGSGG